MAGLKLVLATAILALPLAHSLHRRSELTDSLSQRRSGDLFGDAERRTEKPLIVDNERYVAVVGD